jgi:hypothetical protein
MTEMCELFYKALSPKKILKRVLSLVTTWNNWKMLINLVPLQKLTKAGLKEYICQEYEITIPAVVKKEGSSPKSDHRVVGKSAQQ